MIDDWLIALKKKRGVRTIQVAAGMLKRSLAYGVELRVLANNPFVSKHAQKKFPFTMSSWPARKCRQPLAALDQRCSNDHTPELHTFAFSSRSPMLNAAVLRVDNSALVDGIDIKGRQAKRGSGDGEVWRGYFSVPEGRLRPTMGETIAIGPSDGNRITAVITEVAGRMVHFFANGRMPSLAEA